MSGKISSNGGVAGVLARRRIGAEIAPAPPVDQVEAPDQDVRLVIEEAAATGLVVYTLVDRRTGRVISRRTREEVQKLADDPDYAVGAVVDTKA